MRNTNFKKIAARNVRKACALGNFENFLCLGHGLHNSVYTDGIKKTPDILDIVGKVRRIVKALRYKSSDFTKMNQETHDLINEMQDIGDSDPYFDDDDDESIAFEESDEECSSEQSNGLKSLKLDVVTRWYSILSMFESVKSRGRQAINLVLLK